MTTVYTTLARQTLIVDTPEAIPAFTRLPIPSVTFASRISNSVATTKSIIVTETRIVSTVSVSSQLISSMKPTTLDTSTISRSSASSSLISSSLSSSSSINALSTGKIQLPAISETSKSTSGKTIGMSIGLPVGIFILCLLAFLIYFYSKRNAVPSENVPLSAISKYKYQNGSSWLFRMCCSGDYDEEAALEQNGLNEKKWPFGNSMSSKVQYNISEPIPQSHTTFVKPHILTPAKATISNSYQSIDKDTVSPDTLLHTRPPNSYHVDSRVSTISKGKGNLNGTIKPQTMEINDGNDKVGGKWRYESPLSKWFLRGSTYFRDDGTDNSKNTGTFKSWLTPTLQLKQLKILSRINKSYANEDEPDKFNELSPMLEKSSLKDNLINFNDSSIDSDSSKSSVVEQRTNSVIYGSVLDPKGKQTRLKGELTESKKKLKRKRRIESKYNDYMEYISNQKPLPLTPNIETKTKSGECLKIGSIHQVIEDYYPKLTDEIEIHKGEYVSILASHTDGWCLVEKSTEEGKSKLDNASKSINPSAKGQYLNDKRGIIPGDCLGPLFR